MTPILRSRTEYLAWLSTSVLLWMAIAPADLSAEDQRRTLPTEEWYVSKYNEIIPVWQLESEAESEPGSGTMMVIYEATRYPDAEPTPGHREAAEDLRRRSFEAAKRHGWFDFDQALADGFGPMPTDLAHYVKREFITDAAVLDPDRPEFLLYYDTPKGKRLASFMYLVASPEERGPQVGGPLTVWHYHLWAEPLCLLERLLVVGWPDAAGTCAEGVPSLRSPEMLHVWFIDRPGGRFATDMTLDPWEIRQLAERDF